MIMTDVVRKSLVLEAKYGAIVAKITDGLNPKFTVAIASVDASTPLGQDTLPETCAPLATDAIKSAAW